MSPVCDGLDTSSETALAESSTKEALNWIFQRRALRNQQSNKKAIRRNRREYWKGAITLLLFLLMASALLRKCFNDLGELTRSSKAAQGNYEKCLEDLYKSRSSMTDQNFKDLQKAGEVIIGAWADAVRGPRLFDFF